MRQDRPTRHPALLHPRSPLWVRQAHCPPKLGTGPCSLRPGRSQQRSESRPTASRFSADRERRQCEQSRFPRNGECPSFSPGGSGALPFRFHVQKIMAVHIIANGLHPPPAARCPSEQHHGLLYSALNSASEIERDRSAPNLASARARTSRSRLLQAAHRLLPWRTVHPLALTFSSAC